MQRNSNSTLVSLASLSLANFGLAAAGNFVNPPGLLSFPTLWFLVGIGRSEIGIRIQHSLGASRSG